MNQQTTLRTCVAIAAGWAVLCSGIAGIAAAPKRYAAKPAGKSARAAKKRKPAPAPAPAPSPQSAAPILDDEDPPAEDTTAAPPPAATPTPTEGTPQAPVAGPVVNVDVSAPPVAVPPKSPNPTSSPEELRARYDELRDAVFRSRARRETVEKALFSTKVSFDLRWEANRHYRIEKAEIRLDGTRLWDASERPVTEEPISLAARSVAPGSHVLAVRIEVKSRDSAAAGYVSEQSFAITLPEGKPSQVHITVDEDGSLPSYNPQIEIEIDQ